MSSINPEVGKIICYADDTVILFNDSSWDLCLSSAQLGMSSVARWLENNLLTLNLKKQIFFASTKHLSLHQVMPAQN